MFFNSISGFLQRPYLALLLLSSPTDMASIAKEAHFIHAPNIWFIHPIYLLYTPFAKNIHTNYVTIVTSCTYIDIHKTSFCILIIFSLQILLL